MRHGVVRVVSAMARTPRYALPGPCQAWHFRGRDDHWYRVCLPCDTVITPGGGLPRHLAWGYQREADAAMGVRDHIRQTEANRRAWTAGQERQRAIRQAAMRDDFGLFRHLILGDHDLPLREVPTQEQREIMSDYLRRVDVQLDNLLATD